MADVLGHSEHQTQPAPAAKEEELTPEEKEKAEKEKEKTDKNMKEQLDAFNAMEEVRDGRNIEDIPLNDGFWEAQRIFQIAAKKQSLNFNPPSEKKSPEKSPEKSLETATKHETGHKK